MLVVQLEALGDLRFQQRKEEADVGVHVHESFQGSNATSFFRRAEQRLGAEL